MENEVLIKVRNLVVKYGDNLILDNVGFDVFKGEILFILGSSGCGKTTTMRRGALNFTRRADTRS